MEHIGCIMRGEGDGRKKIEFGVNNWWGMKRGDISEPADWGFTRLVLVGWFPRCWPQGGGAGQAYMLAAATGMQSMTRSGRGATVHDATVRTWVNALKCISDIPISVFSWGFLVIPFYQKATICSRNYCLIYKQNPLLKLHFSLTVVCQVGLTDQIIVKIRLININSSLFKQISKTKAEHFKQAAPDNGVDII